jgi:hypothetical protein
MAQRSEQIRERLFECIHNGEVENCDLMKIFEYIGNDILNLQTRTSYGKVKGKSYNAHQWAKEKVKIKTKEFIVDN